MMAGCISDPVAPVASKSQQTLAASLAPSPGKAVVYVFRPAKLYSSAVIITFRVDGQNVGSLTQDTYLRAELEPGNHRMTACQPGYTAPVGSCEATPGQALFFKLNIGVLKTECTPISQDEAIRLMNSYQLTQSPGN